MRARGISRYAALLLMGGLIALALPGAPAIAETSSPDVASHAWYWEEQESTKITDPTSGADVTTIEAPSPFCPQAPGGLGGPDETCRSGRLPVEVKGSDYETPSMISAVSFDLAAIPLGSTVSKFEATFLEATDEQSEPLNVEGHQLQACLVTDFFGEGEAREYKEAPKFTCSETDPRAKRKAVKGKDDTFEWTFDLTTFAQTWVTDGSFTGIMLFPVEPKESSPAAGDAAWRVVMAGRLEKNGVKTQLVYTPAELDDGFDDFDEGLGDDSTTTTTTGGSTGDFGGTSFGGTTPSTESTETTVPDTSATPEPVAPTDVAAAEIPEVPGGLPAYAWLAILTGIAGFTMFRSVVLEGAAGIRPDGVLAQIRKINTQRRGAAIEELTDAVPGKLAPLTGALRSAGQRITELGGKLPDLRFWKKG